MISSARTWWRWASPSQASAPELGVAAEVADDDGEPAASDWLLEAVDALCQRGNLDCNGGSVDRRDGVEQRQLSLAARPRRQHPETGLPQQHAAEAAAGAVGHVADRGDGGQRKGALLHPGAAEVHRGRAVDENCGLELALGDGGADLQLDRAGRRRPVDAPDVIACCIGPRVGRLAARTGTPGEVLALQQPVEAPPDRQPQPPERRRVAIGGLRCAHAVSRSGATRGAGTAARSRSTMLRGSTPSASAS